jgi:signal transduction histidine kinase
VGIWTPVERPGSRRLRSWAFDGAVTFFALATSALEISTWSPLWAAALVILAMALPLLVRRIWPVPVFAWNFLVAAATGWWANQIVWSVSLVIALYTVAALRPRRDALIAAALLAAGAVVASIHVIRHGWQFSAGALLAVIATALVLGLYIATRRALLAELEERAERLERERDQQGELAAAAERARIAREMHDIVAHHLTVIVTLADGAAAQSAQSPEATAAAMRAVSATGRVALTDTRRLLGVLRDEPVETASRAPLPDLSALDELIERVRAAGVAVRYDVEGSGPDVPPAVQLTLFRLVQEALTNTLKHAGDGVQADVRLRYADGEVCLDIEDDGRGGIATPTGDPGRGLAGMRERVAAFGGTVSVGPRVPHGWQVSARLRLDATAAR